MTRRKYSLSDQMYLTDQMYLVLEQARCLNQRPVSFVPLVETRKLSNQRSLFPYDLKMMMKKRKMSRSDEHLPEVCLLHQVRLWKVSSL